MVSAKLIVSRTMRKVVPLLRTAQMIGQDRWLSTLAWLPRLGTHSRSFGPPAGVSGVDEVCLVSQGKLFLAEEGHGVERMRELVPHSAHDGVFPLFAGLTRYLTQRRFVLAGRGLACCGVESFAYLSEQDRIVDELSFDIWTNARHHLRRRLRLPRAEPITGLVCAVLEPQAATYGHWLLDFAPRLIWAKALLDRDGRKARYLIHYRGKAHERALLGALGIDEKDVIPWEPGHRWEAEEWFIPSYTSWSASNMIREDIDRLRRAFLPGEPKRLKKGRRVYLSRRNDRFRRVRNENEVIAVLRSRGFTVIEPAHFGILEQAELFADAEAVVSVISSGLSNIAFMSPGAIVVEIFPETFFMHVDWALCDLLGLRYFFMFERGRLPETNAPMDNRFADVTVDLAFLERTLELAEIR